MKSQMPPNAPEVEAALISSILTVPNSIYNCIQLLNEDCFYQTKYRIIWNEAVKLHKKGKKIDMVAIVDSVSKNDQLEQIGGIDELIEITTKYFTHDVTGHSKILYQKFMRRNAIRFSHQLIKDSFNQGNDIFSVLNNSKEKMFNVLQPDVSKTQEAYDAINSTLDYIGDNLGKYQEVTGIPTGLMNIDKRTGGFSEGHLIIIGGRPSMGKTTFVINAAWNAYKHFGHSGMFFSCEMSTKEITRLIIAKETGISAQDLKRNKISSIQMHDIRRVFDTKESDSVFLIDDTANAQITHILAEATKAKLKHDIKFIVIDYLQLIKAAGHRNRYSEVSAISKELKALARNLEIPVIALAQLSRGVESRGGDKRPMLSDLKESGDIEQDADSVGFLYRPEYYGIMEDERGNSTEGITELIWRKNRHGEIGVDLLKMEKKFSNFVEFDDRTGFTTSVEDYDMNLVKLQDYNENTIDNFKQKIGLNEELENSDWWNN